MERLLACAGDRREAGDSPLDPDGNSAEAVHHDSLRTGGWIDHLWIRVADVAASKRFYRLHMAFPASDNTTVEEFHRAATEAGYRDNGAPGERAIYPPATTARSSSTPTETTSRS